MASLLSWKHKNLLVLILGIFLGVFLFNFEPFHKLLLGLGTYGYISAFVAGLLYDSTITVSTSIVILLVLAENLSKLEIALIAGLGAVIGDYLVFKFVKNSLLEEFRFIIESFEDGIGRKRVHTLKHLIHSKYFNWMMPVVAAILIGTPFPNELAWGLMGTTKIKTYQVLLVSFTFNFAGIVLILTASNFVKP